MSLGCTPTKGTESPPMWLHKGDEDSAGSSQGRAVYGRRSPVRHQDSKSGHINGQVHNMNHPIQDIQTKSHQVSKKQEQSGLAPSQLHLGPTGTLERTLPGKPQRSLVSRVLVDSWIWEALCWVLSAACVTAITIVLHTYDGQPIPQWSSGITLNAMVSIFTSIAKAALLFPVAESISQLKWIWFTNEFKKPQDFETFDNASKGVWGSILLLCTFKAKHWASLGAATMIAITIIEPFTQQIISFPQHLAPSQDAAAKASVAYSQNFVAGILTHNGSIIDPIEDSINGMVDTSMMLSIYSGIFHPANISIEPIAPECTTGNCTFSDFLSIGVCTKAANITHLLHLKCDKLGRCMLKLPNGLETAPFAIFMNMSTSDPYHNRIPTIAFPNISHPLANVFIVYLDSHGIPMAAEFVFEYCVKHYQATVSNSKSHTSELATYTNYTTGHYDPTFKINSSTLVFSVPNSSATYNVTLLAQASVSSFMGGLFTGYVVAGDTPIPQEGSITTNIFSAENPIIDAITQPPFLQAGIECLMNNVAMSITNNIRSRNNNGIGAPLWGVAYSVVPFVQVQWEWISILVALVLSVLILLIGTVVQSQHAMIKLWKSSNLAVLRAGAGIDDVLRQEWAVGGMERMAVLEAQGKGVELMLINEAGVGGQGWRLIGR